MEKTPKTYTLTINARNFLDKIDGDTVGYTWTKDYTYTGKSMVLELTPKAGTVGLAIDIQDPANTATLANNKLTLTLEDDTTISLIAETDAAKLGRIETAVRTLTLKYESANPTASDLLSRIEMQIMDLVGKDGATVVDLVEKTGDTLANSTIDATTPTVTTKVQFKLKVGSATSASDIEMSVSVTDTQYKALKEAKDAVEALKAFTVNSAGTKDSTVDITSTVATDDIAAAIKENAKVKNIIPTVTVASDDTTNTAITDYDTVAAGSNVTGAAYTVTLKFDETKKVDASVTAATITNGADHD